MLFFYQKMVTVYHISVRTMVFSYEFNIKKRLLFWKIPIKFYGYITDFYVYFTGKIRVAKIRVYYGYNYGYFCHMITG